MKNYCPERKELIAFENKKAVNNMVHMHTKVACLTVLVEHHTAADIHRLSLSLSLSLSLTSLISTLAHSYTSQDVQNTEITVEGRGC